MYYHFQTLIKFHCQLLLFRIKMVDQGHKPVNLGNSDFYEENHEQKSWNLFGRICNKSLLVFFVPIFCYSFDASMCNCPNYVNHDM